MAKVKLNLDARSDADPWQFVKPVTASKVTLNGMESGVEYAFRVAADAIGGAADP